MIKLESFYSLEYREQSPYDNLYKMGILLICVIQTIMF